MLCDDEEALIQEMREWFHENLDQPRRFTTAQPAYDRKRQNGISRFKDSAGEPIAQVQEMVAWPTRHDGPVRIGADDPVGATGIERVRGRLDGLQIVAVPFADCKV
jgi:hypothetical protein